MIQIESRIFLYNTPLVLGTSSPPVRSIACRIASASALKADSDLKQRDESSCGCPSEVLLPMMIILPAQNIDVQCHAGRDGERVKDMRDHLRRQVPYFLPFQAELGNAVWSRANVDDCSRKSLRVMRTICCVVKFGGKRTSSNGAKPVPYRRIPFISPSACLKAVPSAIALSCVVANVSQRNIKKLNAGYLSAVW